MEDLINIVYLHPILYDLNNEHYKNKKRKEKVWTKLALTLSEDVLVIKKKWRNLRDTYCKYLKSSFRGDLYYNRYKKWQWAEHMEPFRKYMSNEDSEIAFDTDERSFKESVEYATDDKEDTDEVQISYGPPAKKQCLDMYDRSANDSEDQTANSEYNDEDQIPNGQNEKKQSFAAHVVSVNSDEYGSGDEPSDNEEDEVEIPHLKEENEKLIPTTDLNQNDSQLKETSGVDISNVNKSEYNGTQIQKLPPKTKQRENQPKRLNSSVQSMLKANAPQNKPFSHTMQQSNCSPQQPMPIEDATDLILMGYSKAIKKLSPESQSTVKLEFAKILYREEIKHIRNKKK